MTDLRHRPATLAVELLGHGAAFVVVGSTARWLVTDEGSPRDLDIVVDPQDVPRLVRALAALGVRSSARALSGAGQSHVDTSWGPLDVFVDGLPSAHGVVFERASGATVVQVVAA